MKRLISGILSVIAVLSVLSNFAFAQDTLNIAFETKPCVYIAGEMYNIVWVNDILSVGYVTVNYSGRTYTYYDSESGIVRSDDYIHTVRLPKAVLDGAGAYTVHASEVISRDGFNIEYGDTVAFSSDFHGYSGQSEIKIGFFSDIHLKPAQNVDKAKTILKNYLGACDVIVLNGDISDALASEQYFTEAILYAGYELSGGSLPVLYVKGNHECRGQYSQYIGKYMHYDTGEMYGTFTYGTASFIVTDIGEDKADNHYEYGGMADFDNYLAEQKNWLENMGGYDKDAEYYIAVSHSPTAVDRLYSGEMLDCLEAYGTELLVGGHWHTLERKDDIADFPVFVDGGVSGSGNSVFAASKLVISKDKFSFVGYNNSGECLLSETVLRTARSLKSSTPIETDVQHEEKYSEQDQQYEELLPTAAGISLLALKGSSQSATLSVGPAVFDSGDYYSVVFMTDASSFMTKAQIRVEKDGSVYTYTDSAGGNVCTDLLHSIRVPKYILDNSTYELLVTYVASYGAYGTKFSYDGVQTDLGYTVSGGKKSFYGIPETDKLNIAAIYGAKGGAKSAAAVKNRLETSLDAVVLLGDMTDALETEKDFVTDILGFAATLSGGSIPVMFTRGTNEWIGEYAPYLSNLIDVIGSATSDALYYGTNLGNTGILILDTAVPSDSGELADTEAYLKNEQLWLSSLETERGYSIAFASSFDSVNRLFSSELSRLKTGVIVTGGAQSSFTSENGYEKLTVGNGDGTLAVLISCADGKISAEMLTDTQISELYFAEFFSPVHVTDNTNVAVYLTDDQKSETYITGDEASETAAMTDLSWYTQLIYESYEYGASERLTEANFESASVNTVDIYIIIANLSGIDFEKLEGKSNSEKAQTWISALGIVSEQNSDLADESFITEFMNNFWTK